MPTAPKTDPVGTIPTFGWLLEWSDPKTNTDKEYLVFLTETNVCVMQWGRIGTSGQSAAGKHPTYQAAEDVGMAKMHGKRASGYKTKVDGMRFMATERAVGAALEGAHYELVTEFRAAVKDGRYTGQRDAVFKHYDEFARQADDVLQAAQAGTMTGAEALERLGQLDDVWDQIQDRHQEVSTTLRLTKAMALQKLSGS